MLAHTKRKVWFCSDYRGPFWRLFNGLLTFCFYFCIGVYSLCDGPRLSRGPYLGITTMCSVLSLMFVSFKAVYIFSVSGIDRSGYVRATEIALFVCSCALAVGHVVVAYRTSCRERRKLLVYKIDIEAVSVSPSYTLLATFFPPKPFFFKLK